MPDNLLITFRLSKELWRSFYEAHYAADHALKMRYLWGVVCIVIGSSGLGGLYESKLVAGLLLATGFYAVLSKSIFVIRSVRSAGRHPFCGEELTVAISRDGIAVRSGKAGYSQPWSNFTSYREVAPGFIFYLDRSAFFFVPATALSADNRAQLQQILQQVELPAL